MIIKATIPTGNYANIQPEFECETFEQGMEEVKDAFKKYAVAGVEIKERSAEILGKNELLKCTLSGKECNYNDDIHKYTTLDNKPMLSGSAFAKRYSKPFEKNIILPKYAKKHGIEPEVIDAMWKIKSKASIDLGKAIHESIELFGKNKHLTQLATADKVPYLHDHPVLKHAVVDFFTERMDEFAYYEAFVMFGGFCGVIDRLLMTGPKKCRVQDYKTNADIMKGSGKLLKPFHHYDGTELNKYWLQLSFYAYICIQNGYEVEGLDIFHWNGTWTTYTHDVVDITEAIK